MYYFKSRYAKCDYSPNWYGTYDYAPAAVVLMYDDNNGICVGHMSEKIPELCYITQEEAFEIIANSKGKNVWSGDKLLHRWDVIEDG